MKLITKLMGKIKAPKESPVDIKELFEAELVAIEGAEGGGPNTCEPEATDVILGATESPGTGVNSGMGTQSHGSLTTVDPLNNTPSGGLLNKP